jgi:[acyl-carrier-protein] S-malonyltransferase
LGCNPFNQDLETMAEFKKIAFLFPGQGAQYVGMGKDFKEHYPEARLIFEEADDYLKRGLSKIIFEGPEQTLTETRNSQTGIYVVSIALLRVIQKLFPHLKPSFCSGLSLGEYSALHSSGRVPFAECLEVVQHRGQFMNDACEATKGTMAVILGLDAQAVEEIVKEANMSNDLWAANFNCPGQVVISGTQKGIEAGSSLAKAKGAKRVLPLQVHGAFHSGLMSQAEDRLAPYIVQLPIHDSKVEFVMNVVGNAVKDTSQIRNNLIKQVTNPVRWEQGVRYMSSIGVDLFIEIGCGKTLSGFNKRIGVSAPTISIEKIEDIKQLEELLK